MGGWVHWVIVVLRLSDEPMCNNVSFIKCWTLMLRWEEVENKLGCFRHEVMVTPFSRGYVNGCNNGFVSHKNPKRNPPGFHEIWVTWPLLIYWSHVQESNYRYCILKLSAERGHGSSITLKCLSLVSREDLLLCFKLFPWKSMWHSSQTSFNQTSSQINCQASSPNEKKQHHACSPSAAAVLKSYLLDGWVVSFWEGNPIHYGQIEQVTSLNFTSQGQLSWFVDLYIPGLLHTASFDELCLQANQRLGRLETALLALKPQIEVGMAMVGRYKKGCVDIMYLLI